MKLLEYTGAKSSSVSTVLLGMFYIKSKLGCWKTFIHSPAEVLEAFSQLGEDLDEFQPCVSDSLSLFILDLYCKLHSKLAREIPFLRWHLYIRLQVESELLSPSPSVIMLQKSGEVQACPF